MMVRMFAIYDEKALVYKTPFTFPQRGQALRVFTDLANDSRTEIGKYPGDFVLYEVGTFDDETGALEAIMPINLGKALEFITADDGPLFKMMEGEKG